MKTTLLPILLLLAIILTLPLAARADQQPEMIAEKMAVKFTRGVTNTFTCIAELPKQSILAVREMGAPGYAIGPAKGILMMFYRGVTGIAETVFFLVPQPGYYDSMIEPTYVWQGWEPKRAATVPAEGEKN